ncbi:autotransporter serine protease [Chachezhania antarctica]|uniref:autotransporter serine protease n=1 Tax=Chachezhania antarctica TaxID=2340860 RepID=UPI000EAF1E7D|nr:autotransporter serine protease [Chachezhania antarctica]|tara:strand:+ start:217 stop:3198 length:2982 start_codon:yes stop_codon:yes gene_type:complete
MTKTAGAAFGVAISIVVTSAPLMAQPAPVDDAEYRANWGLAMIGTLEANQLGYTGKDVVVAIVDSGLAVNHPEFSGRVSPDLRNFGGGLPPDDVSDIDPDDGEIEGHGTHVTGIIGAARNGKGMQGVAYGAILLPLRAITPDDDDPDLPDAELRAEAYAATHGAQVLNGSFGPPTLPKYINDDTDNTIRNPNYRELDFQPIYDDRKTMIANYRRLKALAEADVVMVYSAGNEYIDQPVASAFPTGNGMMPLVTPANTAAGLYGFVQIETEEQFEDGAYYTPLNPSDPAIADLDFSDLKGTLIAVAAVGPDGKIASYSNRCGAAAEWCLAAPGGEIDGKTNGVFSTFPMRTYEYEAGTSMAAPHVTGSAAVLREAFPYMNARQVIETILTTAKDVGPAEIYGQGMLDLGTAVKGPMAFRYDGVFDVDTQGYVSEWSNPISGPAGLRKRGAGTLILSGDNSYAGATNVTGGTLAVTGRLTGATTVRGSGRLAGTGTTGDLMVRAGGTVSPGRAEAPDETVGKMKVAGSFTQQSDSVYELTIDGTAADRIVVEGSATIETGAKIDLLSLAEMPAIGSRFDILTAGGGVTGEYLSPGNAATPFLSFDIVRGARNVALSVGRSDLSFASAARTGNQAATAAALDTLSTGNPVHRQIVRMNTEAAAAAFDELSGEIHASIDAALVEQGQVVQANVLARLRFPSGAVPVPVARNSVAPISGDDGIQAGPTAWGTAFGSRGSTGATNGIAEFDNSIRGLIGGYDVPVGDNWRLGALAGISESSYDSGDRASTGSSENYHVGLYAGSQQGPLGIRAGLIHSRHDIETERYASYGTAFDDLEASYDARTTQVFAEAGYRLDVGGGKFEPYAGLSHVRAHTDGFAETGGAAALTGEAGETDTTFTTLGLRYGTDFSLAGSRATFGAGLGWRHAFGDVDPAASLAFDGSDSFSVSGSPITKDAALIEAGLRVETGARSALLVAYQGEVAENASQYSLSVELGIRF